MLVVLGLATLALTFVPASGKQLAMIAAGFLGLSGLKARVILRHYLGLKYSQFWTRAFDLILGLFLVLALSIFVFGARGQL